VAALCDIPVSDLPVAEAQRRVEAFLTGQMLEAFRAIEYRLAPFDAEPSEASLDECALGEVQLRHVVGASDCTYLVAAFGDSLVLQIQLNVHRFVVVYRVPVREALDAASLQPRLERWRIGAEHAGWTIGWRDALGPEKPPRRLVEIYCYAFAKPDFLADDVQQLYWRTDIVQMTRYFMLEMQRFGVRLAPVGTMGKAAGKSAVKSPGKSAKPV
jgi:hypothetical protein